MTLNTGTKDVSTGRYRTFKLREKRIVIYNPKLAKKQIYEINKEIEKAKLLKSITGKKIRVWGLRQICDLYCSG